MRASLYEAWYFSRLQLSVANAAVTAANSRVLLERVDLLAPLTAALGTFLVYTIDDLLDRARDERRFPHLRSIRVGRNAWFAITVPVAAIVLGCLAREMRLDRIAVLLSLAAFSVAFSTVSILKPAWRHHRHWPVLRTTAVSAVWAGVCVGAPFVYATNDVDSRAVLAYVFEWLTMFVIVALWRHGEHGPTRDGVRRLPLLLESARGDRTALLLGALCTASTLMAIGGVILRLFPPACLAVASAPLATLAFVCAWARVPIDVRLYNDLLALTTIGCAALVLAAYGAR